MKRHIMHLHKNPFEKISSNTQKIESRVYDPKRRKVRVGDIICFLSREDEKVFFERKVVGLLIFDCFENLFSLFAPEYFGGYSISDLLQVRKYFSEVEEKKYGVVGMVLNI